MSKTVRFIGLNSHRFPYTRVRCINFARILEQEKQASEVYALSERYLHDEMDKFLDARDRKKLIVQMKLFRDLIRCTKNTDLFYFQKIHHHIAAPYLIAKLKNIPYVVDYDDWDFDRSPFFHRPALNRFFFGTNGSEQINRKVIENATMCVAASHHLQKTLEEINPNTNLVETGVDMERFDGEKMANQSDIPTFIWSGDVWGDVIVENILFMLASFNSLWASNPNWKLILVLFGNKVEFVKRVIANSFAELPIEVIENVPPNKMPQVYSQANIGLMPLFSEEEQLDWIKGKSPTKLFEYMAMKLIPVCHKIGEAPYIIQHKKNGFLFQNQKEFVAILRHLLDNYWQLKDMREEAYQTVKKSYRIDRLGLRLYDLIQGLSL